MPVVSGFNSGASTIQGDNLLDAIYNSIVYLGYLETKSNKDNPGQTTNIVSWQLTGDATKTFTATLALPARMVKDAVTNKISLVPRNFIVDYLTWVPGTGDLADTTSLPQAIIDLCDSATYLERQIDPNIVIQTPNQVQVTPNQELGVFNIEIILPITVETDPVTFKPLVEVFNYLFVSDTP